MLDTIVYIPTILAYAFITLLVVILCFIVIYVSHKIYISIYDHLPVSAPVSSSLFSQKISRSTTTTTILNKHDSFTRKAKTALRIIVSLDPCYLAYVVFETRDTASSLDWGVNTANAHAFRQDVDSHSALLNNNELIKYFDRLSAIPRTTAMRKCSNQTGGSEGSEGNNSDENGSHESSNGNGVRENSIAILRSLIDSVVSTTNAARISFAGTGSANK